MKVRSREVLLIALVVLGSAVPAAAVSTPIPAAQIGVAGPGFSPALALVSDQTATLIAAHDLSPSIDPAGIAYLSGKDRLLISDSEIDEEPSLWADQNLFEYTRSGTLTAAGESPAARVGSCPPLGSPSPDPACEPSGLAYNPANGHVFVTNDSTEAVYEMAAGPDTVYGTSDDVWTSFVGSAFGANDLEDVAFDLSSENLFLLDGSGQHIYRVAPGPNGIFDGVPPGGDDTVTGFSLFSLALTDPQGLAYRPIADTLLVVDAGSNEVIYEISKSGELIRRIDISFLDASGVSFTPADVVLAPASNGSGATHLYVVDRGDDNGLPDAIPPPQDGKLFELSAPFGGTFADDDGSIFEADIEWLAANGITKGCGPGLYCPNDFVTRGQMAAFLVRALGLTQGAGSNVFTDDDGSIFEADIEKLAFSGITKGCGPGLYCPNDFVTRGQMAAFLHRALG